jgi:hypothetical protein
MVAGEQDGFLAMRSIERGTQPIGEGHGRGSRAKKAPSLHTPCGALSLASAIPASS